MRSLKSMLLMQLAAALAAAAVLLVTALYSGHRLGADAQRSFVAKDVTADILPPPMYLIELRLVLSQGIEGTLTPQAASSEVARLIKEYEARVAYWKANPPFGLEADLLGAQHGAAEKFIAAAQGSILPPLLAGDREAARRALAEVHQLYQAHRAGVDATVKSSAAFAEQAMASFDRVNQAVALIVIAIFLVASVLLALSFVWVRRSVWRAVGAEPAEIAAVARTAAEGDLSHPIMTEHPDSVAGSLERMRQHIAGVVDEVRRGVESVSTASREIAQGNQDLSSRTEQQASSLQQTAASMEQMTSSVKLSADNARQANQLAASASEVAQRGGSVVGDVVSTMEQISASSRKIAEIIGVIDGIAFQTNILALNAAVEAARAGEQGRGFAVVAGEVRNLAQRSAQAAREIKVLISESVGKVESGAALVDDAGRTMEEIVTQVRRVTDLIGEITSSTLEQSSGLQQVNQAVTQLDQVTQQNAALVEQSAAAAASLSEQAQRLAESVSVFKLDTRAATQLIEQARMDSREAAPAY
jgi:methyl-accepting chemotaxis protein